jgi:hypothetical protein
MKKTTKRVHFSPETKNPKTTEKCYCCRHRNIIPQILEMDFCINCFRVVCSNCRSAIGLCAICIYDLYNY